MPITPAELDALFTVGETADIESIALDQLIQTEAMDRRGKRRRRAPHEKNEPDPLPGEIRFTLPPLEENVVQAAVEKWTEKGWNVEVDPPKTRNRHWTMKPIVKQ